MNYEFYLQILLFAGIAIVLFSLYALVGEKKIKSLVSEKVNLEALYTKIEDLEREVERLQSFVNFLLHKLSLAEAQNAVSLDAGEVDDRSSSTEDSFIKRDVLLVCGDEEFCTSDRRALRRSGLLFLRLMYPTAQALAEELRRRRSDGNLYPIIHFSSHGTPTGIELFENNSISGEELSELVDGVDLVFLNTCSNVLIADSLADVVNYVILVYEDIENALAEQFASEFYIQYARGRTITQAFKHALSIVPEVSEYVDLRIKN